MAAGDSLRFGCHDPPPRRIRSREHPFRIAAVNKKIPVGVYVQKYYDSKALADFRKIEMYFRGFLISGMLVSDQR